MKKVFVIFAALLIFGTVLSSCKSNKPPCPAYKGYKSIVVEKQQPDTKV